MQWGLGSGAASSGCFTQRGLGKRCRKILGVACVDVCFCGSRGVRVRARVHVFVVLCIESGLTRLALLLHTTINACWPQCSRVTGLPIKQSSGMRVWGRERRGIRLSIPAKQFCSQRNIPACVVVTCLSLGVLVYERTEL